MPQPINGVAKDVQKPSKPPVFSAAKAKAYQLNQDTGRAEGVRDTETGQSIFWEQAGWLFTATGCPIRPADQH